MQHTDILADFLLIDYSRAIKTLEKKTALVPSTNNNPSQLQVYRTIIVKDARLARQGTLLFEKSTKIRELWAVVIFWAKRNTLRVWHACAVVDSCPLIRLFFSLFWQVPISPLRTAKIQSNHASMFVRDKQVVNFHSSILLPFSFPAHPKSFVQQKIVSTWRYWRE